MSHLLVERLLHDIEAALPEENKPLARELRTVLERGVVVEPQERPEPQQDGHRWVSLNTHYDNAHPEERWRHVSEFSTQGGKNKINASFEWGDFIAHVKWDGCIDLVEYDSQGKPEQDLHICELDTWIQGLLELRTKARAHFEGRDAWGGSMVTYQHGAEGIELPFLVLSSATGPPILGSGNILYIGRPAPEDEE